MKHHIGLTIDSKLLKEIEDLRGREKRSTFIEHLIRLGLKAYTKNGDTEAFDLQKTRSFSKV
ncbi:MAG: hypothetical protein ACUVTB_07325 [Candidatus Bathycorpusculaceae bacterium]